MFWRQMLSLARGGLVTSKPRTNEPRRELGQRPRPKKGREWGMQWLKRSSLRGRRLQLKHQLAESAQDLEGRSATLSDGSASCWRRLISSWPASSTDTTIEMQPCSFGQIRRKQNAISHEILA